jgi:hypothetical protein
MLAILVGLLLGIFICLFIPPKELATKIIIGTLKVCDFITIKGKEQLERIEKEKNEEDGNSKQD